MREYKIIRSKRKSISIQVGRDASVVVRAPVKMPLGRIEAFAQSHADWIEKHAENIERALSEKTDFTFDDGQKLYILGESVSLHSSSTEKDVVLRGGELLIPAGVTDEKREKVVRVYLQRLASDLFSRKLAEFAPKLGVKPARMKITSAKTRWGSCGMRGNICFSYRLVCLSPALIDYVVVHELAHILEHNHSARFYAHVARIVPDYVQRRRGLKEFARKIII